MQQMTLATGTFEPYRKATRREIFLDAARVHLSRQPLDWQQTPQLNRSA